VKIRSRYIASVSFIYLALAAIALAIYPVNRVLFICCEALVMVCAILTLLFFRSFIRPFRILEAGIESIIDKDFTIKFLPVGQPELDRLIDTYNRMIDQLRMERAITSEKNILLGKLIDASLSGIIMLGTDDRIEILNPVAKDILQLEAPGEQEQTIGSLPSPWGETLGSLKENSSVLIRLEGINRYRCYRAHFYDRGIRRSFFFIEELTKELIRAEKNGYEKVIRMISHEINNSVGAVNSILDSTVGFLRQSGKHGTDDFIDALETAGERMVNLNQFTQRFSDVVKVPRPELDECDLRECLNRILIYMKGDLDERRIRVETVFSRAKPKIRFDNQQLELVLINILKNAMEAIGSGGEIRMILSASPVILTVENNGDPISPEIQLRLFEPFFTTKKDGQGIGLTLIREILINHGCRFSLKTREDGITAFMIRFGQPGQ
jgi:two-component system nitrogen regulation sensor histidine kinase NtrY